MFVLVNKNGKYAVKLSEKFMKAMISSVTMVYTISADRQIAFYNICPLNSTYNDFISSHQQLYYYFSFELIVIRVDLVVLGGYKD